MAEPNVDASRNRFFRCHGFAFALCITGTLNQQKSTQQYEGYPFYVGWSFILKVKLGNLEVVQKKDIFMSGRKLLLSTKNFDNAHNLNQLIPAAILRRTAYGTGQDFR